MKAIADYPYADIDDRELHGFLHFPSWEVTLGALGGLRSKGLIEPRESPRRGYQLTEDGKQYMLRKKLNVREKHKERIIDIGGAIIATIIAEEIIRALL